MACGEGNKLYMGFDFSTQQIKVIAVDNNRQTVYEDDVNFDTDLDEFKTKGGVHTSDDGVVVTAPVIMWVKALDMLLGKMKKAGFDFAHVAALSGSGQQHGSVYWTTGARHVLGTLQAEDTMCCQLKNCFSVQDSPVWCDSSTTEQCRHLEAAVGGALKLAEITGARAFERLTGNQIAKIFQNNASGYDKTERISLVSSFAASLFIGDYAPIDLSDGSGMNLLDIHTKKWSSQCLQACADDLENRLGDPIPANTCIGLISAYMVNRYGFSPHCQVISFTGDNPATLAGMAIRENDIIVSLGTSDTILLWVKKPHPLLESLTFVNPVDPDSFMSLICFLNGSLTRQRIRDECADASWEKFNSLLLQTPPGNAGNMGFYYHNHEITPHAIGVFRFGPEGEVVGSFSAATEVRAAVEGQCLAKRLYAERIGCVVGANSRILAAGGASSNKHILQVLADVFNTPVVVSELTNVACLGSAYRAKYGCECDVKASYVDMFGSSDRMHVAAIPNENAASIYDQLLEKHRQLEDVILKKISSS